MILELPRPCLSSIVWFLYLRSADSPLEYISIFTVFFNDSSDSLVYAWEIYLFLCLLDLILESYLHYLYSYQQSLLLLSFGVNGDRIR